MPSTAPHAAHRFTRLLAWAEDGRSLYGCSHGGSGLRGCVETEVRKHGSESPFAVKQEERRQRAVRKGTR